MNGGRWLLAAFVVVPAFAHATSARADEPDPRPVPSAQAFVHIDAGAPADLRRAVGRFGDVVCSAPCDRTIAFNPDDPFSIEGNFPAPSGPFKLGGLGPRVDVDVRAGSKAGIWAGAVTTGIGGTTLVISAFTLGFIVFANALGGGDGIEPGLRNGFFMAMGAGAALLPIGIPILVVSTTKVEVRPSRAAQARGFPILLF